MRVEVNALQPLIMTSIVEYPNGDEVEASLVYERLDKYCRICQFLDHEENDCPFKPEPVPKETAVNSKGEGNLKEHMRFGEVVQTQGRLQSEAYPEFGFRAERRNQQNSEQYNHRSSSSAFNRTRDERNIPRRNLARQSSSNNNAFSRGESRSNRSSQYRDQGRHYERGPWKSPTRPVWMPKIREGIQLGSPVRQMAELSDSSRTHRSQGGSAGRVTSQLPELPREAVDTALGQLRDVMVQYASCPDPTESAARRERARQSEEAGEYQITAENMVRTALLNQNSGTDEPEAALVLQDRIPAILRLGQGNEEFSSEPLAGITKPPVKRRLGRPPAKRTQNSPAGLQGANSRKRKCLQIKGTPRKRVQKVREARTEEVGLTTYHAGGTSKGDIPQLPPRASRISEEEGQPPVGTLNPKSSHGQMDFHSPSSLVP